ncbi:MAG TPA: hypothetical protein VKU00_03065 [Chthonomonadaceae bacterium]|nr:hypothetical protein [Chthonomonadaceae bacterium]
MEADALQSLIAKVEFRKTTYIEPHEYIVRGWSDDCAAVHDALAEKIKTEGYTRRFYGRSYRYVNIAGFRYWLMGPVLNRAVLQEEEGEDNAAAG